MYVCFTHELNFAGFERWQGTTAQEHNPNSRQVLAMCGTLIVRLVVLLIHFVCRWSPGNTITNVQDAGIAVLESFGLDIHDNVITGALYGIRVTLGSADNEVYDNVFEDTEGEKGVVRVRCGEISCVGILNC